MQHKRREDEENGSNETMQDVQGPKAVGVLAGESSKVGLVASVLGVLMMLAVTSYPQALLRGLLCLPAKFRPSDLVAHRAVVPVSLWCGDGGKIVKRSEAVRESVWGGVRDAPKHTQLFHSLLVRPVFVLAVCECHKGMNIL